MSYVKKQVRAIALDALWIALERTLNESRIVYFLKRIGN